MLSLGCADQRSAHADELSVARGAVARIASVIFCQGEAA